MDHSRSFKAPVQYISLQDPALDAEHPEAVKLGVKYLETGEQEHLPLRTGARPAVFALAHLTRQQAERALGMTTPIERFREALALSLVSVTDFWGDPDLKVEHVQVNRMRRVKDDVLDALFGSVPIEGEALFEELGSHVLNGLRLRPTKG